MAKSSTVDLINRMVRYDFEHILPGISKLIMGFGMWIYINQQKKLEYTIFERKPFDVVAWVKGEIKLEPVGNCDQRHDVAKKLFQYWIEYLDETKKALPAPDQLEDIFRFLKPQIIAIAGDIGDFGLKLSVGVTYEYDLKRQEEARVKALAGKPE